MSTTGNQKFDFELISQTSTTTDADSTNDGAQKTAIFNALDDKLTPLIGSLNRMMEDTDAFHGNLQHQVTTLNEGLSSLTKTVESLGNKLVNLQTSHNTLLEHHFQNQTLEWGIQNAHLGSFSFWEGLFHRNSKDIIPTCLLHFKSKESFEIKETLFGEGYDESGKREDFRAKLGKQIKLLTGVSPRFNKVNDTKWFVSHGSAGTTSNIPTSSKRIKKKFVPLVGL